MRAPFRHFKVKMLHFAGNFCRSYNSIFFKIFPSTNKEDFSFQKASTQRKRTWETEHSMKITSLLKKLCFQRSQITFSFFLFHTKYVKQKRTAQKNQDNNTTKKQKRKKIIIINGSTWNAFNTMCLLKQYELILQHFCFVM